MEPGTTRAAVLTVSDGVTQGTREDASGDAAEALLRAASFDVSERRVVADEQVEIESALRELASTNGLVVTTGGTGFGPRDVTPEAPRAVIEREAPGEHRGGVDRGAFGDRGLGLGTGPKANAGIGAARAAAGDGTGEHDDHRDDEAAAVLHGRRS